MEERARRLAALGDPIRLAIVDALVMSDRAPGELGRLVGVEPNLLTHHLDHLARTGLVGRTRSSGDGRRRYVHLRREALVGLLPGASHRLPRPRRAVFVCTANSARSPLAAALWRSMVGGEATSCGTHPAEAVHAGTAAAAARANLMLDADGPKTVDGLIRSGDLVVTVCDRAHEELDAPMEWLHWSIADPARRGSARDFDRAVDELRHRIQALSLDAGTSHA